MLVEAKSSGRTVSVTVGPPGRPRVIEMGRRLSVYVDPNACEAVAEILSDQSSQVSRMDVCRWIEEAIYRSIADAAKPSVNDVFHNEVERVFTAGKHVTVGPHPANEPPRRKEQRSPCPVIRKAHQELMEVMHRAHDHVVLVDETGRQIQCRYTQRCPPDKFKDPSVLVTADIVPDRSDGGGNRLRTRGAKVKAVVRMSDEKRDQYAATRSRLLRDEDRVHPSRSIRSGVIIRKPVPDKV